MNHGSELRRTSINITKRIKEKIVSRKSFRDQKGIRGLINSFKLSSELMILSFGFIVNTFFYFLFIFFSDKAFNHLFNIIFKMLHIDHNNCSMLQSFKHIVILIIWYKYISAGYDGDPFFHLFKNKLKIINKIVSCCSNLIGTFTYTVFLKHVLKKIPHVYQSLNEIILASIYKGEITKSTSFLTHFVYPILPGFLKKLCMDLLIFTCPYINSVSYNKNRQYEKVFISNKELYSSVLMDTYLNELICSLLSYILLYIYIFTKHSLAYPLQINLILTQLIALYSSRYIHITIGPFMSLSWIFEYCLLEKSTLIFLFVLSLFHYIGYKIATKIMKSPKLSFFDAKCCYKNISVDYLQRNILSNGTVDINKIKNKHIDDSATLHNYITFIFKCVSSLFARKEKTN
ncbi:conserved protein, unknown function [Hepatocystis sp. ex Piliocolobus tephrosceles]|nr:conserved protein, unknown function [Hepatocystis sp. ex Piliocolobus tephrosceles]